MTVGESISKRRKELGISQETLGKKLLVSRQTISLWEKNQTLPTIDNLIRLKEIFGISIDEILCGVDKQEQMKINTTSLDTVCGALLYAMGVPAPSGAASRNTEISNYLDKAFGGKKADRVVMYNPDGIAQWIYEKYPEYLYETKKRTDLEIFLASVMPTITAAALATMYTGLRPEIHGIRKYEKTTLRVETLFDALIAAGKRVAVISYKQCSLSRLFLDRKIDYFHFESGAIPDVNAKAIELILRDEHDFIVLYNGSYDYAMHRYGPESARSLSELRVNDHIFANISSAVERNWKHHNTLIGFAPDHGCHEIEGICGSHGLDMVEDVNIVHLYKAYPKSDS